MQELLQIKGTVLFFIFTTKEFEPCSELYDPAGMVSQKKYRDGSFITYSYDALNQLLRETKQKASSIIYDYVYAYDSVGNRLSFTKNTTLGSFWNNDSKNMPAKVRSDMEAAGFGESSPNLNQALALVKNYQYDQGNQLLNWDNTINISTQALPVETVSYSYDNNGNRTLKTRLRSGEALPQETNYSYDYQDRLTKLDYTRVPEVSRTGVQHDTFAYGGDGARVQAVEKNITTNYYYDGSEVVVERDGSENIKKFYSRALGYAGGIGGLISQTSIGAKLVQTTSYYNYDALGSVVNVVSSKGGNSISYDYDAFGNSIVAPSKTNNYLFSTKEFEPRSGLYYFGARYYDPEIGRWLTPDPAGMVDGINLYLYCRNNPINFVDPLGLCEESPWWQWYLTEMALPGSYGQPVSEWGPYGPTSWGDPMKYTEEVGGALMWSERAIVGTAAVATLGAIGAEVAGIGDYSIHALYRAIQRGITPDVVTQTIQQGNKYFDPRYGSDIYKYGKTVVAKVGKVITTIFKQSGNVPSRWIKY